MELTNKEVLEKVAGMFCKYGVKSVSMDDIARELGISKKTIYQHVKDKGELIKVSLTHLKNSHFDRVRQISDLNLNAIEEIFVTNKLIRETMANINPMVEFEMQKYYPQLHKELNDCHDSIAHEIVKSNIEKGISEGLFRDDFNVDLIVMFHFGRVKQLIEMTDTVLPVDWDTAITQLMNYHMRGITTPTGTEMLEENLRKYESELTSNNNNQQQ